MNKYRSERTKQCIKKKWKYRFFSWFLCYGVFIALLIYGFATKWTGGGGEIVAAVKTLMITVVISFFPLLVLSFAVKDKIKPTIRMINVILASYLVADWFMFIVGGLMLIDTYLITHVIEKYKISSITNKEIDKREQ